MKQYYELQAIVAQYVKRCIEVDCKSRKIAFKLSLMYKTSKSQINVSEVRLA
jgi:hypothetical protein